MRCPSQRKFEALSRVLDARRPDRAIVFCATKRMVDEAVERLIARGYQANGLHSDINQAGRERIIGSFRDGRTEVLVATDVAARGLDVPDVSLVVNFDIPPDPEYYVHRIGRTGRVGRGGVAITFVNPREMPELRAIERATGARIRRGEVPTGAEVEERETQVLVERLEEALAQGTWGRYRRRRREPPRGPRPRRRGRRCSVAGRDPATPRHSGDAPSSPAERAGGRASGPRRPASQGPRPRPDEGGERRRPDAPRHPRRRPDPEARRATSSPPWRRS